MNAFLKKTLSGFNYLERIEQGNIKNVLQNPSKYQLNHISAYLNVWAEEDIIVFEFNDGVHFCFIPITKEQFALTDGLHFVDGYWI